MIKILEEEKALISLYKKMLLIRRFEEKAGQLYGMGQIGGFCHLYIGQEAIVVGIESRGFIVGAPLALRLDKGFIPVRKAGKLPGPTHGVEYDLEYGSDLVEVHKDAIESGSRVLMVDDLLATGGTMEGSSRLIEKAGGIIIGYAFVIELIDLKGRTKLDKPVYSLVSFEGD
mgnify:CR=1 FL=1